MLWGFIPAFLVGYLSNFQDLAIMNKAAYENLYQSFVVSILFLLEKEMSSYTSIVWEIPWTVAWWVTDHESQRFGHDVATKQQQQFLFLLGKYLGKLTAKLREIHTVNRAASLG